MIHKPINPQCTLPTKQKNLFQNSEECHKIKEFWNPVEESNAIWGHLNSWDRKLSHGQISIASPLFSNLHSLCSSWISTWSEWNVEQLNSRWSFLDHHSSWSSLIIDKPWQKHCKYTANLLSRFLSDCTWMTYICERIAPRIVHWSSQAPKTSQDRPRCYGKRFLFHCSCPPKSFQDIHMAFQLFLLFTSFSDLVSSHTRPVRAIIRIFNVDILMV